MLRVRLCLIVAVALALGAGMPQGQQSQPAKSEFPLAGLWELLTTRPAWSYDRPLTPGQGKGGPMSGSHEVPGALTRAGEGSGRAPRKVPGALPEAVPLRPADVAEHTTPSVGRGFDAKTSKRNAKLSSATVNVFDNADGTLTRQVYSEPVNSKGSDGVWRPLDNRLKTNKDGRLTPAAHAWGLSFAAGRPAAGAGETALATDAPVDLVSMTFPGGQSFSYGLSGAAQVTPVVSGSTVAYPQILPFTDLELTTLDGAVKETIMLKSAQAATEWVFPLTVSGLTLRVEKDGSISLVNKAKAIVATIPHGWMEDSKRDPQSHETAFSDKVRYELVALAGGQQALKVIADKGWVTDPARVFPIKVDPTVNGITTNHATYVQKPYVANRGGENELKTGHTSYGGNYDTRSFLRFDSMSSAHAGKRISSAQVWFHVFWSGACPSTRASTVSVYEVANAWDANTATSWDNQPGLGAYMGGVTAAANTTVCNNTDSNSYHNPEVGQWWGANIDANGVAVMNRWTSGGANHGLALVAPLDSSDTWKRISSPNLANYKPYLNITYAANVPPRIDRRNPEYGYGSATLTPELMADGVDTDGPQPLTYRFSVADGSNAIIHDSGSWSASRSHVVPAGKLEWGKTYYWYVGVYDGESTVWSPSGHAISMTVPQPLITSGLSQNPSEHGFEPRVGNFTTQATDAQVPSPGPSVAISRSYNSRDPRAGQAFGAGWSSILDARVTPVAETLVVTYPSGQEVAFGQRADGTYAAPSGSVTTTLKKEGASYSLVDGTQTKYVYNNVKGGSTYLSTVTDALGRTLELTYTDGKVTQLKSLATGRLLTIAWAGEQVTSVTNQLGEQWTYGYTSTRLMKVCPPTSITQCTTYEYTNKSLYPAAVLDAAPRTYLRLAEPAGAPAPITSAVDSLDLGSGRYVNMGAIQSASLPGSSATAPTFNGTSSRVELGRSLADFSAYQTVSLRFKTTTAGVLYSLQTGPTGNANGGWTPVLYVGADGKVHAKFWNDIDINQQMVSAQTVTDGIWHHVAIVAMGNKQKLYLDGAETGTEQAGAIQNNWANYAILGAGRWLSWPSSGSGDYSYFNGLISDYAQYTRPLTASQIATLYAAHLEAFPRLNKVVRPSGAVQSKVEYDPLTSIVTKVTDHNAGVWQIGTPTRSGAGQSYAAAVLGSGPLDYFRLHDQSNEVNGGTATFSGVTQGVDGGPLGDERDVSRFVGDSYVKVPSQDYPNASTAHSVSLWFRTKGSGILYTGQNDAIDGYQPALYVGTDRKLHGGYWGANQLVSTAIVNDGQWHHAVMSSTGTTQSLYLDSVKVGTSNSSPEVFSSVNAYLGGGKWAGWPGTSGDWGFFTGDIAEFAYFRSALSDAEARMQFNSRDLSQTVKQLPKSNIVKTGPNSISMWFQLPAGSTSGGVLYSYQNGPLSDPDATTAWVPSMYVGTDGILRAKAWDGTTENMVTSPMNDGNWHHTVLSIGSDGQRIYVDGQEAWYRGSGWGPILDTNSTYAYLGGGKWDSWPQTAGRVGIWPGSITGFTFDTSQWSAAQVQAANAAGRPAGLPDVSPQTGTPVKTVKVTDPMGGVIANTYDLAAGGRQLEIVDARGKSTRLGYDTKGFQRSATDPNGNMTIAEHDDRGNVIARISCQNRAQDKCSTTTYKYFWDAANQADLRNNKMIEMKDPLGNVTIYRLTANGDVYETVDPLGRATKFAYTNANTIPADIAVTGSGRYVRMYGTLRGYAAGFSLWEMEVYGAAENRNLARNRPVTVSTTESSGNAKERAVDGDPWSRWSSGYGSNPEWITVDLGQSFAINRVKLLWETAFGLEYRIEVSNDNTNWTVLKTFGAGNPQQDGGKTPTGLRYRTTDPAGAVQDSLYDRTGDLVESIDAAGVRARNTYDAVGRMRTQTSFTDSFPAGVTTKFEYDGLGRVKRTEEPAILNRVTGATHTKVTTTDYNADGQTTSVTVSDLTGGDASRTTTTEYNTQGQLVSQSDARGNKALFEYDLFGRTIKQTAPDGSVTEAGYDASGHQLTTKHNGQLMESRAYDAGGRLALVTDVMGWTTQFWYADNDLLIKAVRRDPATGKTFMTEHNTYDAAGNQVTTLTNNGVTRTDTAYDAARRVTTEIVDPIGVARRVSYVYGARNEVLSATTSGATGSQTVDASYDGAGRMLTSSVRMPGGSNSPVGWWKLDETTGNTATDSSGSGKNATISGPVTWENGEVRMNRDGVLATSGPVLDTTRSYSVSTWAKLTDNGSWYGAVSQSGSTCYAFYLGLDENTKKWAFHVPASDTVGPVVTAVSGNTVAAVGTWVHLTGVRDVTAGKIKIYVNGNLESTVDAPTPFATSGSFLIGAHRYDGYDQWGFKGALANVQAYQKALTDAEVARLAVRGRGGPPVSSLTTSWTRNQMGAPTTQTDPNGGLSRFTYDEAGRSVMTQSPQVSIEPNDGNVVNASVFNSVGYDTYGGKTHTKDSRGFVTTAKFDANGMPVETVFPSYTQPGGATLTPSVKAVYDNMGRVTSKQDGLGKQTSYAYDQFGRLKTVTTPDGGTTTATYYLSGQPESITDPMGARTEATWDFLGRQLTGTQLVRRSGQSTLALTGSYTYATDTGCKDDGNLGPIGCAGWLIGMTSPEAGRVSGTPTYNRVGETTESKDSFGNTTKALYDFAGRVTTVTAPDNSKQTVEMDPAGRPTVKKQYDASGALIATTSATYDLASQVMSTKDARGTSATFAYDALGRMTSSTQPISATDSVTTSYGYNHSGQATRSTNGLGKVFRTTYNSWGMPESQIEPGGNTFTTVYDAAGRAITQNQPGAVSTSYTYDDMGQVKKVTGTGAESTTVDRTFNYDLAGRVTALSGSGGENTVSYDDRGLPTTISGPSGNSSFTYTNDNLMASRIDAAGTTNYTYDAGGRLATAANSGASLTATLTYNNLSQPTAITYGTNQNRRAFTYDNFGRLYIDELKTSAGASIGKVTYGFDLNNNLTSKTTSGFAGGAAANAYTYDLANRLKTWTTGSTTVDYDYDKAGNRIKAGGRTFAYTDDNRLASSSDGTTYEYTPRGTLRKTTTGTVALDTLADAFGQVTKQYSTATAFSSYVYDGLGRVVNSGFAYTGTGNDLAADPAATYIRGPGGGLLGTNAGGTSTYAWTDRHSDVVAQFTATGTTLSGSQAFDPWGKPLASTGFTGNLGYQSGWTDSATKRVNMAARWYNPDTAQFDSRDSLNVPNRYAYTDSNPLSEVDPSGHQRERIEGGNPTPSAPSTTPPPAPQTPWVCDDVSKRHSSACKPAPPAVDPCFGGSVMSASCQDIKAQQPPPVDLKLRKEANKECEYRRHGAASCMTYEPQCKPPATSATVVLPNCTEVEPYSACFIEGTRWDLTYTDCMAFANNLDQKAGKYQNVEDPRVRDKVAEKHIAEAYQPLAKKHEAAAKQAAEAKCKADWWCDNAELVGIVAGVVIGLGCGVLIGWTGVGAVICGAVGGAAGAYITGKLQGLEGEELWTGVVIGGVIGGVTGGLFSGAGAAAGAGFKGVVTGFVRGGARQAAKDGLKMGAKAFGREIADQVTGKVTGGLAKKGVSEAVEGAAQAAAGVCPHSFDPSTKVLMADGSAKAISAIAIGDRVLATDPDSGESSAQPVTRLHVNADPDLTDVTIRNDDTGETEVLHTTVHHPFWSATDREWTDASDLKPGTRLRDDEGKETQQVVSVKTWTGLQRMHDLTVDTVHTYYVLAADRPVLVHNVDGIRCLITGAAATADALQGQVDAMTAKLGAGVFNKTVGGLHLAEGVNIFAVGARSEISGAQMALMEIGEEAFRIYPRLPSPKQFPLLLGRHHAEGKLLTEMINLGAEPRLLIASNDFCQAFCTPLIERLGGRIISPKVATF